MFSLKNWKIKKIIKKIKTMQLARVNNQPSDQVLKREILYYFELADAYKTLIGNKHYPHAEVMVMEAYQGAALLNDSAAHYLLGKIFIDEAKFRQNLSEEGVLNSDSNRKKYLSLFEEGHAHLLAADKLGHIEAKRLRGLCYINGWGILPDKNAGFELVVASIEQEGSWDKVPQIFAAIGLNKPEFFAAIMQRKKG